MDRVIGEAVLVDVGVVEFWVRGEGSSGVVIGDRHDVVARHVFDGLGLKLDGELSDVGDSAPIVA